MDMSVLTLSRFQFALTIMFNYLFPPLSIGLGGLLVIMEAIYLKTGDKSGLLFLTDIILYNAAALVLEEAGGPGGPANGGY